MNPSLSVTDDAALLMPEPVLPRVGDPVRVSVRDAARNTRQPVATYETDVQLVESLPELGLLYVQDSRGTRYAVDQDTERPVELSPGVAYRALVNAEGYALKVLRLPG